jgi:hypothetical protein
MEFRAEWQSAPVKEIGPAAEVWPTGRQRERKEALPVREMAMRSERKTAARRLA